MPASRVSGPQVRVAGDAQLATGQAAVEAERCSIQAAWSSSAKAMADKRLSYRAEVDVLDAAMPMVMCGDLDTFFVSVERLRDPSLVGKPVVVGGGDDPTKGVVTSASYEVRPFGVRSGMTILEARQLAPHAIFVKSGGGYSFYSKQVLAIVARYSPVVIPASIDEFFLDFTGSARFVAARFGGLHALARRMQNEIWVKTGLPISIGVGTNFLIAKVASKKAKPKGVLTVPPGGERGFLAPMPLEELPGAGPSTVARLEKMGVRTIGELAAVPERVLVAVFGVIGRELRLKALGGDYHPVTGDGVVKSIGHEHTFGNATTDMDEITSELTCLVAEACFRLRRGGYKARLVTFKLRYRDFTTMTKATPVWKTDLDEEVLAAAKYLLEKCHTKSAPVRLIGVRLSKLVSALEDELFPVEERERAREMYKACDRIRERFGFDAVYFGAMHALMAR
jgi:DNA polymerase-4